MTNLYSMSTSQLLLFASIQNPLETTYTTQ